MTNNDRVIPAPIPWHRRTFTLCVCVAPCLACVWTVTGCTPKQTGEQAKDAEVTSSVPVRVAKAELTTLRPSIDVVGTIVAIPERTVVITAQTEGRIQTVSVVEGAAVKSGQPLIQLDTRQVETERLSAEALVHQQQAVLDRMEHGYLPQEIEIARQDVRQARADLEALRLRMNATVKLHDNKEVSEVEFKKLQSMIQRQQAVYAAAQAKLDLYEAGTRPETIAEAQSKLKVARAELAHAQLAVDFCKLTSPLEGIVTQLQARRGAHVALADRLATVVDLSQVFVRIRVPSAFLPSVKQGAGAEVTVSSLGSKRFEGRIERFSGTADPRTGDVHAFAMLGNKTGLLRPGLACRVSVSLPAIERALVVPVSAVADREGISVLHVVRNDKAYEIQVRVGADTRDFIQILEGLQAGDMVITEGGYGLPNGCPVTTTPP